jgi:hypothetical protein
MTTPVSRAWLDSLLDAADPGSMTFHWMLSQMTRSQWRAVVELAAVGQATLQGQVPRRVPGDLSVLCRQLREAERGVLPAPGTALARYAQAQEGQTPAQRLAAATRCVQSSAVAFLADADVAQVWPRQAVA